MNISFGTKPGPYHVQRGIPNQDACAFKCDDDAGVRVFALADGVGSHANSHVGSYVATNTMVDFVFNTITLDDSPRELGGVLQEGFRVARTAVEETRLPQVSATLVVVAQTPTHTAVSCVGDSFVVVRFTDGEYELVQVSQTGEFSNMTETIFTPSPTLDTRVYDTTEVAGFALSSDGLENSTLKNGSPYPGVWDFLFSYNSKKNEQNLDPFFVKLEKAGKLVDDTTLLIAGG